MVEFLPETPELIGKITLIHPDDDGVQWYWTPDDAPAADAPSPPER